MKSTIEVEEGTYLYFNISMPRSEIQCLEDNAGGDINGIHADLVPVRKFRKQLDFEGGICPMSREY